MVSVDLLTIAAILSAVSVIAGIVVTVTDPFRKAMLAIKALLHYRLNRECLRIIERGWATYAEMDDLGELYERYKGIGGNGSGDKSYEMACRVLVISESEAQKRRVAECYYLQSLQEIVKEKINAK